MNEVTWSIGRPIQFDIIAPIDEQDPSVPVVMDAATAIGWLFNKRVRTQITADALITDTSLIVNDTSDYLSGDTVVVMHEDGSLGSYLLAVPPPDLTTLTIPALSDGVRKGALIKKSIIASSKAGVAYGTASLEHQRWGYVVSWGYVDAPSAERDMLLEAYIRVEKVATGAIYTESWDVIVAGARGAP